MSILRVVAVAVALLAGLAEPAYAQARKQVPRKVVQGEPLEIRGRIRSPKAAGAIPRAEVDHSPPARPAPLLPKVTRAVEKEPF
jgi:hypothetical protein